jgi:hypothetical protein
MKYLIVLAIVCSLVLSGCRHPLELAIKRTQRYEEDWIKKHVDKSIQKSYQNMLFSTNSFQNYMIKKIIKSETRKDAINYPVKHFDVLKRFGNPWTEVDVLIWFNPDSAYWINNIEDKVKVHHIKWSKVDKAFQRLEPALRQPGDSLFSVMKRVPFSGNDKGYECIRSSYTKEGKTITIKCKPFYYE